MQGDFKLFMASQGSLESYDIIFIGMSKPELDGLCASRIRDEIGPNSKTKLVICIDYAIELWQGSFHPQLNTLEHELMQADLIFVPEPAIISNVKALINNRKPVYHIVHPTNVDALKKMYKPKGLRSDEIVALIHRYDNNWLAPWLATKDLPWNTIALLLDPSIEPHLYAYFKYVKSGFEFMQYLDWLSRKKCVVDSYHKIHTYGRTAVDNACIQIPTVGSNWTYSQKFLWPDLTTEAGDVFAQNKLLKELMTNDSFYDEVTEKASELVENYNYENCRKELLSKLYN